MVNCRQCGTRFHRKLSQVLKYATIFCSRRCKAGWQREHPRPKNPIKRNCHACGVEVFRVPATNYARVFCSRACASVTLIPGGVRHPLWKGGVSERPYPKEFTKWLKDRIKKRDEWKRRSCGNRTAIGNRLEIHHIDENRSNNIPRNLITLCESCHRAVHRKTISCPVN